MHFRYRTIHTTYQTTLVIYTRKTKEMPESICLFHIHFYKILSKCGSTSNVLVDVLKFCSFRSSLFYFIEYLSFRHPGSLRSIKYTGSSRLIHVNHRQISFSIPGCDDSSESARDDTSSEEEDANVSYQRVALSKMPDNFMLIYPVVSGQQSQRNKIEGSWFISGLKEVLLEKYYREGKAPTPLNFLHYMTEVCNNVARKETVVYQRYVDQKGRTYVDQKGRTRKKKDNYGNKKIDKIWSGLKNTVCIYHRLTNEIIIYPLDQSKPPELLPPNY